MHIETTGNYHKLYLRDKKNMLAPLLEVGILMISFHGLYLKKNFFKIQRLSPRDYFLMDIRRKVEGAFQDFLRLDVIDEWGRMIPNLERWPSSKGRKGFTEVARKVYSIGLKFRIHVMRGVSTQAVNANTPILDSFC
ncbi:hypothetical protein GIB67_030962 [Kingdonia uniflora]|uniref:Uncharacterized protein n=1 Tax=Kingdonia uniflora TaxID=39325 RepID=A0A7J7L3Q8_9MAGN|nr:hypothetical protein GIB67_030962 [Kingdonia uniflora]